MTTELTNDSLFENLDAPEPELNGSSSADVETAEGAEVVISESGDEQTPTPGETETTPKEPTVADVMARMESIERERDGLLGSTVAERKKRQALEQRLTQITETISTIKEQRGKPEVDPEAETLAGDDEFIKTEVDFDEEGNPVGRVSKKELLKLIADQTAELRAAQEATQTQTAQEKAAAAHQKQINTILSQDKSYPAALQDIGAAFKHLDGLYTRHVQVNGIEGQTPDQAIDLILSSGIADQFAKKFPGIDPELLIEMRYAPSPAVYNRRLKRALSQAAKPGKPGVDPKKSAAELKRWANKPGNLSSVTNQRATATSRTLDDVANMGLDDFLDMSDADLAKIEATMERGDDF